MFKILHVPYLWISLISVKVFGSSPLDRLAFSGNDMVSTLHFGSICVRREWIMPMPNYTVFTAIYNQKEEDSQEVVACLER